MVGDRGQEEHQQRRGGQQAAQAQPVHHDRGDDGRGGDRDDREVSGQRAARRELLRQHVGAEEPGPERGGAGLRVPQGQPRPRRRDDGEGAGGGGERQEREDRKPRRADAERRQERLLEPSVLGAAQDGADDRRLAPARGRRGGAEHAGGRRDPEGGRRDRQPAPREPEREGQERERRDEEPRPGHVAAKGEVVRGVVDEHRERDAGDDERLRPEPAPPHQHEPDDREREDRRHDEQPLGAEEQLEGGPEMRRRHAVEAGCLDADAVVAGRPSITARP